MDNTAGLGSVVSLDVDLLECHFGRHRGLEMLKKVCPARSRSALYCTQSVTLIVREKFLWREDIRLEQDIRCMLLPLGSTKATRVKMTDLVSRMVSKSRAIWSTRTALTP